MNPEPDADSARLFRVRARTLPKPPFACAAAHLLVMQAAVRRASSAGRANAIWAGGH